jgi:hypothetical protein
MFRLHAIIDRGSFLSQIGVELPMDSDDADEENKSQNGKTLLYVLERGYYTVSAKICLLA